jgi:glycosyltransferase involved in cell wall biosynthesis
VTLLLSDAAVKLAAQVDRKIVNLQTFRVPKLRHPANLGMVWRLHKWLDKIRPDLVHITYWHLWDTPALGLSMSAPLIATVHDVSRHQGERGVWAVPSALYPLQWRWADQIIVHASPARRELLTRYACESANVHVIPIGTYDFYSAFAGDNHEERTNTILFFGRIWGYKGLEYLIQAEPLITKEVPDARIIIAGQGAAFSPYRQAMVHPQHFEVHNYRIPDEMVAKLFQSASLIVLPYTEASQSGVIPIAYAFGKPVVATTVGGIPDVVDHGQTGYLVPPRDPHALAEAIINLLKDPQKRLEMGRKAAKKAQEDLSWANIAKRTMLVYERALAADSRDQHRIHTQYR